MQRDNQYPTVLVRQGAEAAAKAVLVKFTFNNESWVPKGIRRKDRQNDASMDYFHQRDLFTFEDPSLGEIGRHRPNRVDTGTPTVNNAQQVHAGIIRRALRNNGYVLSDLHYFEKKEQGRPSKYVVVADFKPVSPETLERVPELLSGTVEALRALAKTTWNFCHVWENQNGVITVNFVGRMPDQAPRRAIIVRDGALEIDLVEQVMPEEQESELAMNAAFELWQGAGFNPHLTDTNLVAGKVEDAATRGEVSGS
jgi:hypothetical protein